MDSANNKKKTTITFEKNITPPHGSGLPHNSGTYFSNDRALPLPRETSNKRPSPLPLRKRASKPRQKVIEPPLDSCPTPVISLGYREFHARMELIASRFESQSLVFRKHPLKMDLAKAKLCDALADDCRRMAARILNWPKLSSAGLAGEKSWMAERYMDIITDGADLFEGEIL